MGNRSADVDKMPPIHTIKRQECKSCHGNSPSRRDIAKDIVKGARGGVTLSALNSAGRGAQVICWLRMPINCVRPLGRRSLRRWAGVQAEAWGASIKSSMTLGDALGVFVPARAHLAGRTTSDSSGIGWDNWERKELSEMVFCSFVLSFFRSGFAIKKGDLPVL